MLVRAPQSQSAPKPVELIERPSRDLGAVPLGRLGEDPGVGLAEKLEMDQTAARPGKRCKKLLITEDPHLADEIKAVKVVALFLSFTVSRHHLSPIVGPTIMMLFLNFNSCLLPGCGWDR